MMSQSEELNVLIVDDHPVVREGCRSLFKSAGDLRLIEAENPSDMLTLYEQERPDVVLLDINLPDTGGLELLTTLLKAYPAANILMFSMYDNAALAARAIELGASGYITKNSAVPHLITAIRQIASGKPFLDPNLVQDVVFINLDIPGSQGDKRDTMIMDLLGQGKTLREIVSITGISYRTVCRICTRLKSRLNVTSINALSRLAVLRNIVSNHPDGRQKT